MIHIIVCQQHTSAIHLVIDGWTAPFAALYLGIVIVWFAIGQIHQCILEFVRYDHVYC